MMDGAPASDAMAQVRAAQGAAAVQAVYAAIQSPNAWWASAVHVFCQAVELDVEEHREISDTYGDIAALPHHEVSGT